MGNKYCAAGLVITQAATLLERDDLTPSERRLVWQVYDRMRAKFEPGVPCVFAENPDTIVDVTGRGPQVVQARGPQVAGPATIQ